MGLAEALISVPQSEKGGEIAQRGFDYQTCWALSEMLEYELEGKDYVFIFEYHDDVLILDNEKNPKKLIFAQVKTRDKNWTAFNLYGTSKKKPISIIGKLYLHQKNFSEYSPKLLFITNATFSFHPKTGNKTFFNASLVDKKIKNKFVEMVLNQIEIDNVDLTALDFIQSNLSFEDHIVHLTGKLCEFLTIKFGNDFNLNPKSLSLLLESQCREKSKFNSDSISSFLELVKKKGFSSKEFNNLIDSLNRNVQMKPTWDKAKDVFNSLGKTLIEMISLESTFSQACIDISKSGQNTCSIYLKESNKLYDKSKIENSLNDFLNETIIRIDKMYPNYALTVKKDKKECVVVYSIIQNLLEEGE